ncbi:MAG TPA: class I SAM-dependent methyltransferase [Longimicrobiales bacterium]|nr:class I SAM-dependent methyltransferase [Longimicrobiales bacterium]
MAEPSPDRIGPEYYDESDYFGSAPRHLRNPDSPFQKYRIRKVQEIYRPGKEDRVLDLGCGWGTFTFAFAPVVREVVGVDFSEKSIELCRRRAREEGVRNVDFHRVDAADTGLDRESFDVIVAADFLEHLDRDQTGAVLDECARLLKRGGRLVVWTPHGGHFLELLRNRTSLLPADPTHVDYKTMERLRRLLLDRGFSIEKAYYAESHVPVLQDVERSFMSFVPLLRRRIAMLARKR